MGSQDTLVVVFASMACAAVLALAVLLLSNSARRARPKDSPQPPQPPQQQPPQPPQTDLDIPGPVRGRTWTVQATYYGPDRLHGRNSGDDIFQFTPAGQYTPDQLRAIAKHHCAMSEKFLKKGFMGKIIRVRGSKATLDVAVVDMLPDRNDGKGVEIDIHTQADWEALGGDAAVGIQTVSFSVVGEASIPVADNSPWQPKKWGF